jgi:hypothetical protein
MSVSVFVFIVVPAIAFIACVVAAVTIGRRLPRRHAELEKRIKRGADIAGSETVVTGKIDAEVESVDESAAVTCANCKFFDLDNAQQAMANNAAFRRVMTIIPPYEHNKRVRYEDEPCPTCMPGSKPGEGAPCPTCGGQRTVQRVIEEYPPNIPKTARWSEFGWCTNENVSSESGAAYNERILWSGVSNCDGRLFQPKSRLRVVS